MCNQVQEAARQILGQVSDIQAVVSMCGLDEVSLKLADIREKAAWLLEGGKGPASVIAGYEGETYISLNMLGGAINSLECGASKLSDPNMIHLIRMAEIFASRGQVYLERKKRFETVIDNETQIQGDTDD